MLFPEGRRISLTVLLVALTTVGSSFGQDVSLIRIVTSIWSSGNISIKTPCEVLWWYHSQSVTKNLTPYRFNSVFVWIHIVCDRYTLEYAHFTYFNTIGPLSLSSNFGTAFITLSHSLSYFICCHFHFFLCLSVCVFKFVLSCDKASDVYFYWPNSRLSPELWLDRVWPRLQFGLVHAMITFSLITYKKFRCRFCR